MGSGANYIDSGTEDGVGMIAGSGDDCVMVSEVGDPSEGSGTGRQPAAFIYTASSNTWGTRQLVATSGRCNMDNCSPSAFVSSDGKARWLQWSVERNDGHWGSSTNQAGAGRRRSSGFVAAGKGLMPGLGPVQRSAAPNALAARRQPAPVARL